MIVATRAKIPAEADRRLERLRAERMRLEVAALLATRRAIEAHRLDMRAALEGLADPTAPWTVADHARAVPVLRVFGARLGAESTRRAVVAAKAAVALGLAHFVKAWSAIGGVLTRRKVPPPPFDPAAARPKALEVAEARTADVGVFAGEDAAQRAVVESYRVARAIKPEAGAVAALVVAEAWRDRAVANVERVIVTEITAGYSIGGEAAFRAVAPRVPRLKKVWDATLDRRVCRRCRPLHHVVVPHDEPFPGGYYDAPAHARCRCAVMPWFDDWSDALVEADTTPGPRTGVQATAEEHLEAWQDEPIEGWRPSRR